MMNEIIHGDCLIESDKIASGSVDLILTDLPYGTVTGAPKNWTVNNESSHAWDLAINPADIYVIANRILRKNGKMVLFSQEPYTTRLINEAIPNIPFSYRAIWEKDNFANALLCNKAMVGYYEDILIFSKMNPKEDNTGKNPVREYLIEEKKKSGLTNKDFNRMFSAHTNKQGCTDRSIIEHYWSKEQFRFPTQDIYENILQKTGYFKKPYSFIEELGKPYRLMVNERLNNENPAIFNLWEGGKYKSNILRYKKDYSGYHPTQKPVLLLEDLIKTFSNGGDTVVDLTVGSGSTAVAAINTNRNFIGIERELEYVEIARKRIAEAKGAE